MLKQPGPWLEQSPRREQEISRDVSSISLQIENSYTAEERD
ncbi:hypothetical protein [Acetobacter garciniae]|nr:hypothetical protein [Acetobacter garciniae]